MRHTAMSFAAELAESLAGESFDALFASSMLNLAELIGLAPERLGAIPAVVYFHENQLSYPDAHRDVRDVHFGLIHLSSIVAAEAIWFNSGYHRNSFVQAMDEMLSSMPAPDLRSQLRDAERRFDVAYPGIDVSCDWPTPRPPGPMRILWAGRWEHDKNPEDVFAAISDLDAAGCDFRLAVIGEQFRDGPAVFDRARQRWADRIDHWGYQPSRDAYEAVLSWADVCVSTAVHEFFGLSMVEAARAGAMVLLPRRLAYPEVFGCVDRAEELFYDGSVEDLSARLIDLVRRREKGQPWPVDIARLRLAMAAFDWPGRAWAMDDAIEALAR